MKIEINHRYDERILFEGKFSSIKIALEVAVGKGADLEGADLEVAYLKGAYLKKLNIPIFKNPYSKILKAINGQSKNLNMEDWHTCETTHCIGGWLVHLCGKDGYDLEEKVGMPGAATLIFKNSGSRIPNYFADKKTAMEFIKEQAELESKV